MCHRIKATTGSGTEGNEEGACGMFTFFFAAGNMRGHPRGNSYKDTHAQRCVYCGGKILSSGSRGLFLLSNREA